MIFKIGRVSSDDDFVKIEINTLEDLIKMIDEENHRFIIGHYPKAKREDDRIPKITIYDDYL